jgi:hypothetical protein
MTQNPRPQVPAASSRSVPNDERPIRHFNQIDLSRRWKLSERTLERWRWQKIGPSYLKVGGRVVYRLEDVEAFETRQLRQPASAISNQSK